MKTTIYLAATCASIVAAGLSSARADLVTFEDVSDSFSPLPDNYHGLQWGNFYSLDAVDFAPGTGFATGATSGTNVAFNGFGDDAIISSAATFTLNGLSLTAANNDGISVTIDGYRNGVLVDSFSTTADTTAPLLLNLAFSDVDQVQFSTGNFDIFAIDDVDVSMSGPITPVPEAQSYGTVVAGILLTMIAMKRRKLLVC